MSTTTRIKVCGITRIDDAVCAQDLGVDAIGFMFLAASKRAVELDVAAKIAAELSPYMVRVGLFLNADASEVHRAIEAIPNLVPQFHGTETPEFCDAFKRPYVKAIGVAGGMPSESDLAAYRYSQGFLFDSHAPGELGGTGHPFDWSVLEQNGPPGLILAGGLNPSNVAEAVERVRPYAVDVSSGVEQAYGVKDPAKMKAFVDAVRSADARLA